jgi:serine/threonine-protein kinase
MTDRLDDLKAALAGRYAIEREIGSGGMATVYLARDMKHERQVAVKVLRPELAAALGRERFLQEIKIAANLHHPHILALYDSGEADGFLYYVMPHAEGESLRDRLDRDKQLPLDDAVRITREVAGALAYAHSRGVIHRDIKPENILLESGHAMVADFGIARAVTEAGGEGLTKTGIAIGTPMYMSPEQASGERDVDARSDIYSLGCVVYEMLVGQPPFTGPTPQAITARKLSEPVPAMGVVRDTVPTRLEQAIRTALAKVPADRFTTAHQFADALGGASIGEAVSSGPAQPVPSVPSARRGLRWGVVAPVAAVVLAVGLWAVLRDGAGDTRAAPGQPDTVRSVGVLPFADRSAGATQEYFADGLTEEVVMALSRVPGLRVPGSASTFFFKGSTSELAAIAESLNVRSLLTGSVQRDAGRVRIRVQLLNAANGFQLWSEAYERRLEDMFEVYDDVARSIVSALQVRLGGRGGTVAQAPPTRSPEAYDAYLLGKYHLDHRGIDSALTYLTRAVELDTAFVLAWSALADAHNLSSPATYSVEGVSGAAATAAAGAAARRALALDSLSGPAHSALAAVFDAQFRWDEAGREWRTAIALDPDNAHARHWYAIHLLTVGRPAAALAEVRRAQELDPLSRIIGIYVGQIAMVAGDSVGAVQEFERLVDLFPRSVRVAREAARMFLVAGEIEAAATQYARSWELRGADSAAVTRVYEGIRFRQAETLRMVADSIPWWYARSPLLVAAGDTAAAIEDIRNIRVMPGELVAGDLFTYVDGALRQLPEFRSILQRMNLQDRQ